MSDKRNNRSLTFGGAATAAVGVGVLAGLGYALYKSSQDEASPVKALVDSLFKMPEKCGECGQELMDDKNKIKLLCNHVYHKSCLLSVFNQNSMMSLKPFTCPAKECYFIIPGSVISSLKGPASPSGRGLSPVKSFNKSSPSNPDKETNSENFSPGRRIVTNLPNCEICCELIKDGDTITLPCSHVYHKECIIANHAVKVVMKGNENYSCPIVTCQKVVPNDVLDSFMYEEKGDKNHKSNVTSCLSESDKEKGVSSTSGQETSRYSKTLIEHCAICKEFFHIEETYELPCKHLFHKNCLKYRCPFRIHYGSGHENTCPITSCKHIIPLSLVQQLART